MIFLKSPNDIKQIKYRTLSTEIEYFKLQKTFYTLIHKYMVGLNRESKKKASINKFWNFNYFIQIQNGTLSTEIENFKTSIFFISFNNSCKQKSSKKQKNNKVKSFQNTVAIFRINTIKYRFFYFTYVELLGFVVVAY